MPCRPILPPGAHRRAGPGADREHLADSSFTQAGIFQTFTMYGTYVTCKAVHCRENKHQNREIGTKSLYFYQKYGECMNILPEVTYELCISCAEPSF